MAGLADPPLTAMTHFPFTLRRMLGIALAALVLAGLGGCAGPSGERQAEPSASAVPKGARDLRSSYRRHLCHRLAAEQPCEDVLRRLPGEPVASARPAAAVDPAVLARRYRVAFVPGLLSGCAGAVVQPFADVAVELQQQGFDAQILEVGGRASSHANGDLIAQQLGATTDVRPFIVFAYSKGLPDMLEALVRHPVLARQVAAVVGYAGAAGGSQLVGELSDTARSILLHLPMPGCPAVDDGALVDLRQDVRHAWWRAHGASLRVPLYALVAAPHAEQVSPVLRGTYAHLGETDSLNDGQLLARDAIAPGSALLGFVNADHWAMAIPLSQQLPVLQLMFRDNVPRTALVTAAIETIDQDRRSRHATARPR